MPEVSSDRIFLPETIFDVWQLFVTIPTVTGKFTKIKNELWTKELRSCCRVMIHVCDEIFSCMLSPVSVEFRPGSDFILGSNLAAISHEDTTILNFAKKKYLYSKLYTSRTYKRNKV